MAAPGIGNKNELTCTDGSGSGGDVFNVNTKDGQVEIPNAKPIKFYSDAYTTLTGQITNGIVSPPVSAAAAALATSGTITTSGVGVARTNPGSAVSAVVMGTGTVNGQQVWVVNEAAQANSITFAASATSNVSAGINDVIWGGEAKLYVWDANFGSGLWVDATNIGGTTKLTPSSAAAAIATSGTVTTANVGLARLNPGSAVTACVMATGTLPGQLCLLVNEAAQGNTIQFAASATSNVADGINAIIPGAQARLFAWDSAQSLWFEISPLVAGALVSNQSVTAVAIATSGTVTTAGIGHSRLNPGSAVTSIVMGTGTYPGQLCMVTNEASVGNYAQMAASATSNVADGINCIIPGVSSRLFVWDSATSLWYDTSQTNFGTVDLGQSATAAAIATSGTVTTQGVGLARLNPGSAITAAVMQAGIFPGQLCVVVNEAAQANTIQFAASATSNVADGVSCLIPGVQARLFAWDSGTSLWYEITPLVAGALAPIQSATAAALAISGTITTAGVGVARVNPGSAVTSCVMQAGTQPGQKVTVINEAAGGNTINFAASATSNVADGATTAIAGLRSAEYTWDSSTNLWYHS